MLDLVILATIAMDADPNVIAGRTRWARRSATPPPVAENMPVAGSRFNRREKNSINMIPSQKTGMLTPRRAKTIVA
jgi:hypothetical protein